jgi:hypothetical protein
MALSKPQLKELVHRVVVAQGNSFIKELLRNSGAKIGTTKEDFANNLDVAIEGVLRASQSEKVAKIIAVHLGATAHMCLSAALTGVADSKALDFGHTPDAR